jgi:hypothetical protein
MLSIRVITVVTAVFALAACASNPPRPVKSQFEDIPVSKGMSYQSGESMSIETPTVQAAREVYRGRVEIESLATATRTTLEVYEKQGTSLQVLLWEGLIYTYAEYTTARVLQAPK